jgi:diketogulonate reductase-like aldo/keto reductase
MIKTKKYNRDRAQILLRWSLQKGFVLFPFISTCLILYLPPSYVPLPKSDTPSRIHSNANLYDFELAEDDIQKLDALDRGKAGAVSWNPINHP